MTSQRRFARLPTESEPQASLPPRFEDDPVLRALMRDATPAPARRRRPAAKAKGAPKPATLPWLTLGAALAAAPLAPTLLAGGAIDPVGLAASTALPALALFALVAARREAARARAQADEVLALARRAFLPDAEDDPAARFGGRVRREVAALDEAVRRAAETLRVLDGAAASHLQAIEKSLARLEVRAVEARRAFAAEIGQLTELERAAAQQSRALRASAAEGLEALAAGRQSLAEQCAAIDRASQGLAARTEALRAAGTDAAGAAGMLDETLARALEALAESSRLNDTSKRAIDAAARHAVAAAAAVRDALRGAEDAPKAASDARRPWRGFAAIAAEPPGRTPLDLFADAGIDLEAALPGAALERIAQQSPMSRAARRRAVREAAEPAVERLARHLRRHPGARERADRFRADPDLAAAEDGAAGPRLARAYLLIDAALD